MLRALKCLLAVIVLVLTAGSLSAQDAAPQRPLPGLAPPASERGLNALRPSAQAAAPPVRAAEMGVVDRVWAWVLQTQQRINRELAQAVRGLKTDPINAAFVLAWLSFAYGVLHAAGPGHGKAVISAYVLANERTVRRGILLSFMAAFFQGLSALLVVGILSVLLKATSLTMRSAEAWIETVSWALVAGVGVWLLWSQARPWLARRTAAAAAPAAAASGHGHAHTANHAHDHGAGDCGCGHTHHHARDDHAQGRAHTPHGDLHGAGHGDDAHLHGHPHRTDGAHGHVHTDDCCGHAHMPAPRDLEGAWSWRKAIALAVSVGIRPCTGAILVLLFAISQGLWWAGVFATFAMALGTAITVSVLAALAVGSRELATRMAGGDGAWATRIAATAGVVGAVLVIALGMAGFVGSLKGPGAF